MIVEFFTKRGRPLSKDEIQKLVEEDRRAREAEESRKRADEEAERRRNQRIQNELEEEEDYEGTASRTKGEKSTSKAARDLDENDKLATRPDAGFDSEDDEYDSEDEDDDLERGDDEEGSDQDMMDNGEAGQGGSAEKAEKGNLSKTKLS